MADIMDLSYPGQRTTTANCVSLTIVYTGTCQDHMLESLKMASSGNEGPQKKVTK